MTRKYDHPLKIRISAEQSQKLRKHFSWKIGKLLRVEIDRLIAEAESSQQDPA